MKPAVPLLQQGPPSQVHSSRSASSPPRICALLPDAKDNYWWGVSWALASHAKQKGISLGIYFSAGYADVASQQRQWALCEALGAQAIVVAAVNAEGLKSEAARAMKQGIVVVDFVNGASYRTSLQAALNFNQIADLVGARVKAVSRKTRPVVAWFPGPADSAQVNDTEVRLRQVFAQQGVQLGIGGYGPPDPGHQAGLVRGYLQAKPTPDFIVGNAAAVVFAGRYFKRRPPPMPILISVGVSHEVVSLLRDGLIDSIVTDTPIHNARAVLDAAVAAVVGPRSGVGSLELPVLLLTKASLPQVDLSSLLPPASQWLVQQPLPPYFSFDQADR